MNLRWLKWLAIILPALFLILLDLVSRLYLESTYPDEREKAKILALGAAGYLLKDLDLQGPLQQIKSPQASGVHGNPTGGDR